MSNEPKKPSALTDAAAVHDLYNSTFEALQTYTKAGRVDIGRIDAPGTPQDGMPRRQLYYHDGSDAFANQRKMAISIQHVPSARSLYFKAFIVNFAETYVPSWNEEHIYGRGSPTQLYKNTTRKFSLSYTIPASTPEEAYENLGKVQTLIKFLYPNYAEIKSSGTKTVSQSPFLRLKVMNLAQKNIAEDRAQFPYGVTLEDPFKKAIEQYGKESFVEILKEEEAKKAGAAKRQAAQEAAQARYTNVVGQSLPSDKDQYEADKDKIEKVKTQIKDTAAQLDMYKPGSKKHDKLLEKIENLSGDHADLGAMVAAHGASQEERPAWEAFKNYKSNPASSQGLLGVLRNLTIDHHLHDIGGFVKADNTILPKQIDISFDYEVIHEQALGWNEKGTFGPSQTP